MITNLRIYLGVCLYQLAFAIQDHCAGKAPTASVTNGAASPSVSRVTSGRG